MKKLTTLALVSGLAVSSLFLAACGKTEAPAAPASVYVKDFNATDAYVKLYTEQLTSEDFNKALPLSGDFTALLNTISSVAGQVEQAAPEAKESTENAALLGLYQQFTAVVDAYKADAEKATTDGITFDLATADLSALLAELEAGCAANGNYQASVETIEAEVTKAGKTLPEDAKASIAAWNDNFAKTCALTSDFVKITKAEGFTFDGLAAKVAEQAAPAEETVAPAEGEQAPATEGEAAPAEGEQAPAAEGEAAPAEGEAAPAEGEQAPATEEKK